MKLEAFRQLDTANLVLDTNHGPFNAYMGIVQSDLDTVLFANLNLPGGAVRGFPPGSSGIELQIHESFASQAALDAAFTNGNYTFAMATRNDGNQSPVLTMPVAVYPAAPRLSNFAAAQAINPASPFLLEWTNPADATGNDILWVVIFDSNDSIVFSTPYPPLNPSTRLNGTDTSVVVPANTLSPGAAYTGSIGFYRMTSVNRTSYPGVVGVTLVAAQTAFPLAAPSLLPVLSLPTRTSATQFGFLLSGVAGQNYTVLTTTNPAQPLADWSTVLTTNLPASSAFLRDNQATSQRRYYRAKVGP
jgi:hypothetical protein